MSGIKPIKAIQTHYASCHFRSRLEARWAVFFDCLAIPWEYETEGFETSVGNYLPDFRIHMPDDQYPYWFEVKPAGAPWDDRHRVLCVETATPMIVARDMPRSYVDQLRGSDSPITAMLWGDRLEGAVIPAGELQPHVYPAAFVGRMRGPSLGSCRMWDGIKKARPYVCSAEFEDAHIALYGAEPDHHHRVPINSMDVDAAYRIARSARFERGETEIEAEIWRVFGTRR
jgi:hypothetical protein